MSIPTVLTIAGSDSGGGAGIQADLKAIAAVGLHGASAVTCITAQNTKGLSRTEPLPVEAIVEQAQTVANDLDVVAVKTGMLRTPEVVEVVAGFVAGLDVPLVVDPVMVATSGDDLAGSGLSEAFSALVDHTTLITPNADEAAAMVGRPVRRLEDAEHAADALLEQGWRAVLLKGGHLDTSTVVDLLVTPEGCDQLTYPRLDGVFHGSGCTYASLIAALLARGHDIDDAVVEARARLQRALVRAYRPGQGPAVPDALESVIAVDAGGGALSAAAWRIAATIPIDLVPEVGINIAYAPERASVGSDVFALTRRMTRTPAGVTAPGPVARGASSHVARVLVAAQAQMEDIHVALNLRFSETNVRAVEKTGLELAWFSRADEPPEVEGTMEWGTGAALLAHGGRADVIVDEGQPGKEAMMRVLARSPDELVRRVGRIAQAL